MHPLYQRLKELDSDTFEKLCFHLVKARLPNADIRHVDGAAGDEGIDLFLGSLDAGPTVWQCKSFPNGVGKHQKEQIKASFKRALRHFPKKWVLCLSVDMDVGAHRWFERLVSSYAKYEVQIELMQACDIVQELFYWSTIREMFFPDAVMDVLALRETIAKTGSLSTEELARLNTENIDQYLKRLEDLDPRFAYSVTYRRDVRPPAASRPEPGLIASVSDDTKTIDVFARDVEAVTLNPPTANFTIGSSGVDKMNEFIRSGRTQVFEAGELLDFSCDLSFLGPKADQIRPVKLVIGPSADRRHFLTRVVFGSGDRSVVYECIRLECTRQGRGEAEFQSSGALPFCMSLVVKFSGTGSANFKPHFDGADVRDVQKFMRGMGAMYQSGELELYDLEKSVRLVKLHMSGDLPPWFSSYDLLVADLAAIAGFYGLNLNMPDVPTNDDLRSLALLKGLICGVSLDVSDITFKLAKVTQATPERAETVREEGTYRITRPEYPFRPVLFGNPVCTGPVVFDVPRARVENPEEIYNFLTTAQVGQTITLSLKPTCPVHVRAVRPNASVPA